MKEFLHHWQGPKKDRGKTLWKIYKNKSKCLQDDFLCQACFLGLIYK